MMRASPARESGVQSWASGPEGRGAAWQASRFTSASFTEIHLRARSMPGSGTPGASAYAHLLAALASQGASPADVIAEKIFLTDMDSQASEVLGARSEFYGPGRGGTAAGPAGSLVRQPPLGSGSTLEVKALALLTSVGRPVPSWNVIGLPPGVTGRAVEHGDLLFLHLAGITGGRPGDDLPFDGQAASLFRRARTLLLQEGFDFRDVFRTWIYLDDVDHDYEALNLARREFFTTHDISILPASTGIQGGACPPDRLCTMDLRAVTGLLPGAVHTIHAPTLNEAPSYGSDFSRGIRLDLGDRSLLHLSGTASIDDRGEIVHPGSIEKQADRMLLNVERLLEGQDAGPEDLMTLTTYLKRPEFVEPFLEVAARRSFPDSVPHTICLAGVCRPGWLCEIEGLAVVS